MTGPTSIKPNTSTSLDLPPDSTKKPPPESSFFKDRTVSKVPSAKKKLYSKIKTMAKNLRKRIISALSRKKVYTLQTISVETLNKPEKTQSSAPKHTPESVPSNKPKSPPTIQPKPPSTEKKHPEKYSFQSTATPSTQANSSRPNSNIITETESDSPIYDVPTKPIPKPRTKRPQSLKNQMEASEDGIYQAIGPANSTLSSHQKSMSSHQKSTPPIYDVPRAQAQAASSKSKAPKAAPQLTLSQADEKAFIDQANQLLQTSPIELKNKVSYQAQLEGTQTDPESLNSMISKAEAIAIQHTESQKNTRKTNKQHLNSMLQELNIRKEQILLLQKNDFSTLETCTKFQNEQLKIAEKTIQKLLADPKTSSTAKIKLLELRTNLSIEALNVQPNSENIKLDVTLKATKKAIHKAIINTGVSKAALKKSWSTSQGLTFNDREWETIHKEVGVKHDGKLSTFNSKLEPASKIRIKAESGQGKRDPFEHQYHQKGSASSTKESTLHANNLYKTELSTTLKNGAKKTLFAGVRSGSIAGQKFKKSSEKRKASIDTWGKEILTAALAHKIETNPILMDQIKAGQPIPLKLLSTSLLTPDSFRHTTGIHDDEKALQESQSNILKEFEKNPPQLLIYDQTGAPHQVTIKLDVATINPGVNMLSLDKKASTLIRPWKTADNYSKLGLEKLIGPPNESKKISGWAGDWLKNTSSDHPDYQTVKALAEQIQTIFTSKAHHSVGNDAYKLVTRAQLLAYKIGVVPHINCKSGKDRTGEADARTKELAAEIELRGLPEYSTEPKSARRKEQLQSFMYGSGQTEVLLNNTGMPLYKTITAKKDLGESASLLLYG